MRSILSGLDEFDRLLKSMFVLMGSGFEEG